MISTGWFQERIRAWLHNRTLINWGSCGRLAIRSNKLHVKYRQHQNLNNLLENDEDKTNITLKLTVTLPGQYIDKTPKEYHSYTDMYSIFFLWRRSLFTEIQLVLIVLCRHLTSVMMLLSSSSSCNTFLWQFHYRSIWGKPPNVSFKGQWHKRCWFIGYHHGDIGSSASRWRTWQAPYWIY